MTIHFLSFAILAVGASSVKSTHAAAFLPASSKTPSTKLQAAPRRLEDNVDGPLYVNDKCINCAACSQFAPASFTRSDGATSGHHVVYRQPETDGEIEQARAAMSACPVAAIRVETKAHRQHRKMDSMSPQHEQLVNELALNPKFNGRPLPFPRPIIPERLSENGENDAIYFVGHHNEKSFGATPYLLKSPMHGWIMVDSPKYSKLSVDAVESLTGPEGPSYMLITHVDDSAGHGDWKNHYPNLQRIFHQGDLGRHNWIGDRTLEEVEVLLKERSSQEEGLKFFTLEGKATDPTDTTSSEDDTLLIHTPGHSPGSLSLWKRPTATSPGVLFTGDTYAYTTRNNGSMTGFPRYGNDLQVQSQTLRQLLELDWQVIAPGHGHVRVYHNDASDSTHKNDRALEMKPALKELQQR